MGGFLLDGKDKLILEQLELNCRKSNAAIAKKAGLSKDAVGYRIKKLEKQKVILGYYSVLDIAKLGFVSYKFMITFQNTTSEIEKEIIRYLQENPLIGWLVSCDGYYNLMAIAWVKNPITFDYFFTAFLEKYSHYFKQRDLIVLTEIHSCQKAYMFDKKQDDTPDTHYKGDPESRLDKTELAIVRFLSNNAKAPLQEIASTVGLTPEAAAYRIKQLSQKNILQAFRPLIDTAALGYQYYNILFRLKKFDQLKKIFLFAKQHPNIIYFAKYLGSFDLGMDIETKNPDELRRIIEHIKDVFSEDIESYLALQIYQQHKLSFFPE